MQRANYPVLLRECKLAIMRVDEDIKRLYAWRRVLKRERTALNRLAGDYETLNAIYGQLAFPEMDAPIVRRSHVQIMEDILSEYGPLHVTTLVAIAMKRGVPFNGKKTQAEQARDKLNNSKRFHLFGGNVWGLPEHADAYEETTSTDRYGNPIMNSSKDQPPT